jgi:parallel beta-helix repeat protein
MRNYVWAVCLLLLVILVSLSVSELDMSIKHATQTTKTNNPNYDVSADAWNAAHTLDDQAIVMSKLSGTFHGIAAYVGFDVTKTGLTNYWYCDGAADDVQINAAITYVNGLGGGIVLLEQGIYTTTAAITLLANVHVIGEGVDTAIASTAAISLLSGSSANNVSIRFLSITGGGAGNQEGISLTSCDHAIIEGVAITAITGAGNTAHGILLTTSDNCVIHNCSIYPLQNDCIKLSGCNDCRITANDSTVGNGVLVTTQTGYASKRNTITGNNCSFMDDNNGIYLNDSAGEGMEDNTVTGNTCVGNDNTGRAGIKVNPGNGNTISGNTCSENRNGITLEDSNENNNGSKQNTVSGNTIKGNTLYGIYLNFALRNNVSGNMIDCENLASTRGIYLQQNSNTKLCEGNLIAGNVVYDANDDGIVLWVTAGVKASPDNVVRNNTIIGCASDGIMVDDMDDTIVEQNFVEGSGAYGLRIVAATTNCLVNQNTFRNNTTGDLLDGGTATIIHGATGHGYVTRNSGSATIANGTSSTAVTHGLSATPTSVTVSGSHTEVDLLYVTAIGAAQFTINASDGNTSDNRTVYWRAEVV